MKIREVTQKAENLIEQGENAKQRQVHYQQAANSARAQLMSAYARLEAASETDEDGEPMGDVAGAQAELFAAQAFLNSAELGLADATRQLEGIDQQKLDTVQEIERYETTGEGNLAILAQLQAKQFGSNAAAFMADLAARMNSGEQMRQQLLQSMGMSSTAKNFSAAGSPGGGYGYHDPHSVSQVHQESWHNSNFSYAPVSFSHKQKIAYDYSKRAYAIMNNSSLSNAEKINLLKLERAKMHNMIESSNVPDSFSVKAKTMGGNTVTKAHTPSERYEELKASYCEDIGKILADPSLDNSQKLAKVRDIQQAYSDTLQTENLIASDGGLYGGPLSWFGSKAADSTKYKGIDVTTAARPSIDRIPRGTYYSPEMREKVISHPRFSGMTEFDGRRAYVFAMNDAKLNNLQYTQGNNEKGWRMTCGIAQSANMLSRAGINETEKSMVNYCSKHNLCDQSSIFNKGNNGGTSPARIATMLSNKGLPAHYDNTLDADHIANLVENGHGVIVGVNAGCLWSSYGGSAYDAGQANHAISVIGTLRDEYTHEVVGFFINDTGRGQTGDQKRMIPIAKFNEAFDVPYHAVIATDKPIT